MCSVAWTVTTGTCSATQTTLLASTTLSSFSSAQSLSNVPALAATNGIAHLQFSLTLVGSETSTNGTLPSPTIQGLNTTIT
jgi:hypothetical protein